MESFFGVIFGVVFGVVGISFDTQCRMESLLIGHCNRGTLAVNVHAMHWLRRGGTTVRAPWKERSMGRNARSLWATVCP